MEKEKNANDMSLREYNNYLRSASISESQDITDGAISEQIDVRVMNVKDFMESTDDTSIEILPDDFVNDSIALAKKRFKLK